MNIEDAKNYIFDRLSEGEIINCVVSTSRIQGNGKMVDMDCRGTVPIIKIKMKNGIEYVPCFGVMVA